MQWQRQRRVSSAPLTCLPQPASLLPSPSPSHSAANCNLCICFCCSAEILVFLVRSFFGCLGRCKQVSYVPFSVYPLHALEERQRDKKRERETAKPLQPSAAFAAAELVGQSLLRVFIKRKCKTTKSKNKSKEFVQKKAARLILL